jgi:uncharacterized membrane protein YccC
MPDDAAAGTENNGRISKIELVRQDVSHLLESFDDFKEETRHWREKVDNRLSALEKYQITQEALETAGRDVTWPNLKDKILIPALQYAIALVIGFVFAKLTGWLP